MTWIKMIRDRRGPLVALKAHAGPNAPRPPYELRARNGFRATLNTYRFSVLLPAGRIGSTIRRCRSALEIELRRMSSRLYFSPAKYIWVTIMLKNPPYTLKWMCGGRTQPPGTGYAPGLMVLNEYLPSASVVASPNPRKFGSFGAGLGSATWVYRPLALACQISTMAPLTGRHSSSVTRPVT